MKCPTCGTDNLEGTRYCGDCGAKLSRKPDSSRASMPLPEASATPTNAEAIQPVEEAKLILTATGNEYPINKDIVLLGRESIPDSIFPDIDLTLVDPEGYVSREHAKIQRQDKQYTIIDLDSTNGTFVNNDRLEEDTPHPLTNNDEIRAGKIVLKFLLDNQADRLSLSANEADEEVKDTVDKEHQQKRKGINRLLRR